LLAHHYLSALELVQASGAASIDLVRRTRTALRAAGTRALTLNAYAAAARSFEAASDLAAEPDPDRPRALLSHGLALHALSDARRFDLLEEARLALVAIGDTDGAAEADLMLTEAWWWAGERDRCSACLERAVALVREGDAPAARASVLAQTARFHSLFGEQEAAIDRAGQSLDIAETLGRDDLRAKNLITLGTAHFHVHDFDPEVAIGQIREGIELATGCGDFAQFSRGLVNLASLLAESGELAHAESVMREAAAVAQRRGHVPGIIFTEGNLIDADLLLGRWESVQRRAKEFLAAHEGHYMSSIALYSLSVIELGSDETDLALRHADEAVAAGRRVRDPQALVPALAYGAFVYAELGESDRARALLEELEPGAFIGSIASAFFAAARLELTDEFRASTSKFQRATLWDKASDAVLDGRWDDAAEAYDEIGAPPFAALAALHAAEMYAAQGRHSEANEQLMRALPFWRSVGAKRYIRQGEALLAKSA
jgi:hypothetical protein